VEEKFHSFIARHGKTYSREEYIYRLGVFERNMEEIARLNSQSRNAVYGVTLFTDLTKEEFSQLLGYRSNETHTPMEELETSPNALPSSFDWRTKGVVTAVKDQGSCGSCWAFSATEEIESMVLRAGRPAVILSPQQIVDCDHVGVAGCSGGDTKSAYNYVIRAGGIETAASYPYTARNGACHDNGPKAAIIESWGMAISNPATLTIQTALYNIGPLSICVDAQTWQSYRGGIITGNCGTNLDHCVQLIGWGVESNIPYWIIRNSWGIGWGEEGYLRVEAGKGLCGIALEVTYVTAI